MSPHVAAIARNSSLTRASAESRAQYCSASAVLAIRPAEGMDETHRLHRLRIDAPIPVKPHCRCVPVVDHSVLSGVDRHERCDTDTTVQPLPIKAIQLECHSFKGMDLRACGTDTAIIEHGVREMFGNEQIRPALPHLGVHWR